MTGAALLLSGPIGLGHEMPVRSFRDLLERSGWQVRTRDSLSLLGSAPARAGQRVFDRLMTVPAIYDGLHFASWRTGGRLARLAERAAAARSAAALRAELDREPADLVLSVFATGALATATLREATLREAAMRDAGLRNTGLRNTGLRNTGLRNTGLPNKGAPDFRSVVYCPDVAVHKLWVHEGTDLFCVSSPAAAASVRRFRPRAPIALVPPPVRAAFYDAPDQLPAREALGIPATARCALLMDSGWGFAPMRGAAAALADAGVHVLAVAGRNAAVEREFRELAATSPRVTPFGFTDQVPALMAAANLVITLPGAATCAEARVIGRRLLLLDVMPGHGRDNLLHELELGDAEVCGPASTDIAASALAMFDLPARVAGSRAPHWEPAFAAALSMIGIDVDLEEACAPSS